MRKNRSLRVFLVSFFAAMIVFALALGLAAVDYQCRKTGFGDEKTLIYQITGKNLNFACIADGICYNNSCDLRILSGPGEMRRVSPDLRSDGR